jgi:hypothetical protein
MDSHMSTYDSPKPVRKLISITQAVSELERSPALTSPMRSQRLMDRRRLQKKVEKSTTHLLKASPGGELIFSDSDNDASPTITVASNKISGTANDKCTTLNVVDVCANRTLFDTFSEELKNQTQFAISLACTKWQKESGISDTGQPAGIGQRVTRQKNKAKVINKIAKKLETGVIEAMGIKITGVSIVWSNLDAYFMPLGEDYKSQAEMDDTIAPCTQDTMSITLEDKIELLKSVLCSTTKSRKSSKRVAVFDLKTFIKVAYLGLGINLDHSDRIKFLDPKVAAWMIKPGETEKTLATLVMTIKPELSGLLETLGSSSGAGSVGMVPEAAKNPMKLQNLASPRSRALAESALVFNLIGKMVAELVANGLFSSFTGKGVRIC